MLRLEKVIGTIPNVLSKGIMAKKIIQKLLKFRCDSFAAENDEDNCDNIFREFSSSSSSGISGPGSLPLSASQNVVDEDDDVFDFDYSSSPRGLIDTLIM